MRASPETKPAQAAQTLQPRGAPPVAVLAAIAQLQRRGAEAALAGGCVRDYFLGRAAHDWDICTSADAEQILRAFPRAVAIGRAHGTALLPATCAPIEITPFRPGANSLEEELGRRDFTLNAMAWRPPSKCDANTRWREGEWVDPWGGRADVKARLLRATADTAARLEEDPLRALRAARLAAELGFKTDPALVRALGGSARRLMLETAAERVRAELERLLRAPHAQRGVALLRRTGLEAALLPGAQADAAEIIAALPADLELRLAAWLRGARARALLSRWRFPHKRTHAVERLLALHPIDAPAYQKRGGARRLRARAGSNRALLQLIALRRAELARSGDSAQALQQIVGQLQSAVKQAVHRRELALTGGEVAALLGGRPGPKVGRALHYLTECVIKKPSLNKREKLIALLREFE